MITITEYQEYTYEQIHLFDTTPYTKDEKSSSEEHDTLPASEGILDDDPDEDLGSGFAVDTGRDEEVIQAELDFEWITLTADGDKPNPRYLQLGDILAIRRNSSIWKGVFVTKGFWDGRDKDNPSFYFFERDDGGFLDFDPNWTEWMRIGFDDSYVPPRTDNITELLIEHLRSVPVTKRIPAFHQFEGNYPYTSYYYHPFVKEAWDKAIVAATTLDEVVELSHEKSLRKLPKEVARYITNTFPSVPPEERMENLYQIRYVENKYDTRFIYEFPVRQMTYYKPLLLHWIPKVSDPKVLLALVSLWGLQFSKSDYEPPANVWLEREDGSLEVV